MKAIEIKVKNRKSDISRVQQQFNAFAEENSIAKPDTRKVNVALDELLTNIASYAHPDGGEHDVEIGIELTDDRLTISIQDGGVPFNPFDAEPPDTTLSLEEREIGGLGIHLVPNLVDEADYERRLDKNVVTLIKRLAPPE